MLEQFHLVGKRHSGRAVRLEALDDITVAENLTNAAKLLGPDAVYAELKKREWAFGVKQFIKQVSEPCENPLDPKVKWTKVDVTHFDDGLSKYFTSKDVIILEALYREFHDVTKDELDAIVGKGLAVSEA